MIPKTLRLYVGGSGAQRKVLLENRSNNSGLLLQADVCAELHSSELSQIRAMCDRVADVYASIGVLLLYDGEGNEIRYLGLVTACNSAGKLIDCEMCCVTDVMFVEIVEGDGVDKTASFKKLLCHGTFFFGMTAESGNICDITVNMQSKLNKGLASDSRFLWNRSLFTHPLKFIPDLSTWFVNLICGSVSISTIYCGNQQAHAAVISRVSSERAGTRFQVRGVDDNGCVANFVETEQCVVLGERVSSFLQVRGSVPVFWEQSGIQVGSHKLTMTRGYELTQVAYDKHMTLLKRNYGLVMILNLLSNKADSDENRLSKQYQAHQMDSVHDDVMIRNFDYHSACRGGRTEPINTLYKDIETFVGFSGIFRQNGVECVGIQEGVLRTNCLDCIDRTNAVQSYVAHKVLYRQLEHISAVPQIDKFQTALEKCWHTNANLVSRTYCGTGALKTASGKMGKITDATRSVKRTIQNNFLDDDRQESIEDFLMYPDKPLAPVISKCERFLPSTFVEGLLSESKHYSTKLPIRVAVGTWNSNGGKIMKDDKDKLAEWLLDAPEVASALQNKTSATICDDLLGLDGNNLQPETDDIDSKTPSYGYVDKSAVHHKDGPDVIAIGLQELVDLTAGNIVSTSQTKRGLWSSRFQEILCRDANYILLSAKQLVGVCLFVFVKAKHLQHCTDICIDAIKTGLKGKTGNKGGVAISLNLYSTSLCFVCAHLAAGQTNVLDRNKHYELIRDKALFHNGMEIEDHDYVFWCGDFNYRIDYANHEIRDLVKKKAWYELQCGDQLTVQKNEGKVFQNYNEGPLEFAPTYKYDLDSDYYDTSEKFRSPAWCDRVLWRCNERYCYMDTLSPGKLVFYGNTEIKTSDHRPVLGVIDIEVRKIDSEQKLSMYSKVFRGIGPPNPTVCVTCKPVPMKPQVELSDLVTAVLQEMQQFGVITLVRVPEGIMHFTFENSVSAIHALQLDETEVSNHILDIHLKSATDDWMALLGLEPTPVNYQITPIEKLLDIETPSDVASDDDGTVDEPCEEEEEEEEEYSDVSDVGSGEEDELHEEYTPVILKSLPANQITPVKKAPPPRPPPPARPPPPKLSAAGLSHPHSTISTPVSEPPVATTFDPPQTTNSQPRPVRPIPPPSFTRPTTVPVRGGSNTSSPEPNRPPRPTHRPSSDAIKRSQPARPAPPPQPSSKAEYSVEPPVLRHESHPAMKSTGHESDFSSSDAISNFKDAVPHPKDAVSHPNDTVSHEYAAPVVTPRNEEYVDYRDNDPTEPVPVRPMRPSRPPNSKISFLGKTGQSAKDFITEKFSPDKKSDMDIGQPYGISKSSEIKQFEDGTYKITLDDGRVIVYEKGQAPVVADSRPPADTTTDSGGGSASVTGAPPTSVAGAPLASVRPVRPSPNRPSQPPPVAKMADVQVSEMCLIDPDDIFNENLLNDPVPRYYGDFTAPLSEPPFQPTLQFDTPLPQPTALPFFSPPPPPSSRPEQQAPPSRPLQLPTRPSPNASSTHLPLQVDLSSAGDVPAPKRPVRPNADELSKSLPRGTDPASCTADLVDLSLPGGTQPISDVTQSSDESSSTAGYSSLSHATSGTLSDFAILGGFDGTLCAGTDPKLHSIKSEGDMDSVINLVTPSSSNEYANIVNEAASSNQGLGGGTPPPSRPPRPSRPKRHNP